MLVLADAMLADESRLVDVVASVEAAPAPVPEAELVPATEPVPEVVLVPAVVPEVEPVDAVPLNEPVLEVELLGEVEVLAVSVLELVDGVADAVVEDDEGEELVELSEPLPLALAAPLREPEALVDELGEVLEVLAWSLVAPAAPVPLVLPVELKEPEPLVEPVLLSEPLPLVLEPPSVLDAPVPVAPGLVLAEVEPVLPYVEPVVPLEAVEDGEVADWSDEVELRAPLPLAAPVAPKEPLAVVEELGVELELDGVEPLIVVELEDGLEDEELFNDVLLFVVELLLMLVEPLVLACG